MYSVHPSRWWELTERIWEWPFWVWPEIQFHPLFLNAAKRRLLGKNICRGQVYSENFGEYSSMCGVETSRGEGSFNHITESLLHYSVQTAFEARQISASTTPYWNRQQYTWTWIAETDTCWFFFCFLFVCLFLCVCLVFFYCKSLILSLSPLINNFSRLSIYFIYLSIENHTCLVCRHTPAYIVAHTKIRTCSPFLSFFIFSSS